MDEQLKKQAVDSVEKALGNDDDAALILALKMVKLPDMLEFVTGLDLDTKRSLDNQISEVVISLIAVRELTMYPPSWGRDDVAKRVNDVVVKVADILGYTYPEKLRLPL